MRRRLLWSLRVFHLSLAGLLVAGVLAAAAWQYERDDLIRLCNGAIVAAAVVACGARCWQWSVQRAIRRVDFSVGPGHYTIDPLGDGRFTA
jgi:hypothetical protein